MALDKKMEGEKDKREERVRIYFKVHQKHKLIIILKRQRREFQYRFLSFFFTQHTHTKINKFTSHS